MPGAARSLCLPASTTRVPRRARPRVSAALSPAAPAPITTQSLVVLSRAFMPSTEPAAGARAHVLPCAGIRVCAPA